MWTVMAILLAFYVGFFTASALAGSKRLRNQAEDRQQPSGSAIYKTSGAKVRRSIEAMTSPGASVQASRN